MCALKQAKKQKQHTVLNVTAKVIEGARVETRQVYLFQSMGSEGNAKKFS